MIRKAIIISIKGPKLSSKEKTLLSKEKPWGLILFKRNIKSLIQTKTLIKSIRNCVKDKKFPILIDEEGSKVSRLRSIISHNINANYFGNLYKINKRHAVNLYKNYLRSLNCSNLLFSVFFLLPVDTVRGVSLRTWTRPFFFGDVNDKKFDENIHDDWIGATP